jgi:hypothetical protein
MDKIWCRVSFVPDFYVNVFPILKFLRNIVRSHFVPVGLLIILNVNTKKCSGSGCLNEFSHQSSLEVPNMLIVR